MWGSFCSWTSRGSSSMCCSSLVASDRYLYTYISYISRTFKYINYNIYQKTLSWVYMCIYIFIIYSASMFLNNWKGCSDLYKPVGGAKESGGQCSALTKKISAIGTWGRHPQNCERDLVSALGLPLVTWWTIIRMLPSFKKIMAH